MAPLAPVHAAPFDARLVRQRRARAAKAAPGSAFLHARAAEELAERLAAVNRTFARALVIGGAEAFATAIAARPELAARIGLVITADLTLDLVKPPGVVLDPEHLAIAPQSLDLIVAVLGLHWINDLPGALAQARRALRPDGLFLGAMLGGDTLHELREALTTAEAEVIGGAGLRVGPFADLRDAAGLLQRAGFALPVADLDRARVRYADPLRLLWDLRAMGETSALTDRPPPLRREALMRAMALYAERFSDPDGRVRATFDTLHLSGWAPDPSQQQPLRPGSAKARLADALGAIEITAGEKAGPPSSS